MSTLNFTIVPNWNWCVYLFIKLPHKFFWHVPFLPFQIPLYLIKRWEATFTHFGEVLNEVLNGHEKLLKIHFSVQKPIRVVSQRWRDHSEMGSGTPVAKRSLVPWPAPYSYFLTQWGWLCKFCTQTKVTQACLNNFCYVRDMFGPERRPLCSLEVETWDLRRISCWEVIWGKKEGWKERLGLNLSC